jgi:2-C-methyl-D-erythritol 4-phosphate cytidylyltransferase
MTGDSPGAVVILLAAGSGSRVGGDRPKAFLTVDGRSLLTMSAQAACASSRVASLVVAVPPGWEGRAAALLPGRASAVVVAGGASRQESVRLAIEAVPAGCRVVVVHDSARAMATSELFDAVVAGLDGDQEVQGVIPVVPIPDTVKRVDGGVVTGTVPRDDLVIAQTPQAFLREQLAAAHARAAAEREEFTDDAAVVEWAGGSVKTVPGSSENFKITTRGDLDRAEAALRAPSGST